MNFLSFDSRAPTDDDLRRDNIILVEISPQVSYWDPNSTHYSENEEALVDVSEEVIDAPDKDPGKLFVETVNEEDEFGWNEVEESLGIASCAVEAERERQ